MKIFIGLGNPGANYHLTRHNIGFLLLDYFCGKHNIFENDFKEKFSSLYHKSCIKQQDLIFIKPLTYMNNSGKSLFQWQKFYKIDISNIIVIYDDLDLKFGRIKLSNNFSSAGHNGIKSINSFFPNTKINKIRIGIGRPDYKGQVNDYVLGKFTKKEIDILDNNILPLGNKILNKSINNNFTALMNKFNQIK